MLVGGPLEAADDSAEVYAPDELASMTGRNDKLGAPCSVPPMKKLLGGFSILLPPVASRLHLSGLSSTLSLAVLPETPGESLLMGGSFLNIVSSWVVMGESVVGISSRKLSSSTLMETLSSSWLL